MVCIDAAKAGEDRTYGADGRLPVCAVRRLTFMNKLDRDIRDPDGAAG